MSRRQAKPATSAAALRFVVSLTLTLAGSVACGTSAKNSATVSAPDVRIGIGQLPLTSPQNGVREIGQILSIESLFSFTAEDGRPRALLAESWTVDPSRRFVRIRIRPDVKFHDGTPLRATIVADILRRTLAMTMGPARADFNSVEVRGDNELEVRFNTASPFLLEALEATIEKPDSPGIGTGSYKIAPGSPTVLLPNQEYYLGAPKTSRLVLSTYPSVRAAWADMLRGNIDLLYEVSVDALDSLAGATQVSVFIFTRRYQHVVILNPRRPALRSAAVRRALNLAIDRDALVKVALNGYGIPSSGAVWPRHWAFSGDLPRFKFEPKTAATLLRESTVRFNCLVPPGPPYERLALEIKRQLAAVGVDMTVEEASPDHLLDASRKQDFEAVLLDVASGPTLFRPYITWHSNGPRNPSGLATPDRDAALDRIRHAANDDEYRDAVAAFQNETVDDPPAIFLAWSQRARAVSKRFVVPTPEVGRDILSTLRLWTPSHDERFADRN